MSSQSLYNEKLGKIHCCFLLIRPKTPAPASFCYFLFPFDFDFVFPLLLPLPPFRSPVLVNLTDLLLPLLEVRELPRLERRSDFKMEGGLGAGELLEPEPSRERPRGFGVPGRFGLAFVEALLFPGGSTTGAAIFTLYFWHSSGLSCTK